jgi:secreted Zn-dependent insulinase-like peptidase
MKVKVYRSNYGDNFPETFHLTFENEQDVNTVINFITTVFSLSDEEDSTTPPPVVEDGLLTVLYDIEYEFLKENKDVLDIELFEEC